MPVVSGYARGAGGGQCVEYSHGACATAAAGTIGMTHRVLFAVCGGGAQCGRSGRLNSWARRGPKRSTIGPGGASCRRAGNVPVVAVNLCVGEPVRVYLLV